MFVKRKDFESLKRENTELKAKNTAQMARINMLKTEVDNLKKWERKIDPNTKKFIKQN